MTTQNGEFDRIEGLGATGIELLVACGVEDLGSLAESDAGSLYLEMGSANSHLRIAREIPSVNEVQGWVSGARNLLGFDDPDEVIPLTDEVVVLRADESPQREADVVPEAIPVSAALILEQNIAVKDVPPMEHFIEDEVARPAAKRSVGTAARKAVQVREVASEAPVRRELQTAEEPAPVERRKVEPLQKNPVHDIRKSVSAGLNEGKKLHSRGFIRGVLHPQPFRVRFGALLSIITLTLLPATFVAGGLILAGFSHWLVLIPLAFLFFGLLYLMYARGMKCRICGQPLFAPKACHRHVKAHRIPVIGYILPTSLQILIFHWFRCMYCGTSIRVKE